MRIAFLTHEPFHPPSGGGSAEAVYLVREMARRKHEVHLFCPQTAEREAVEREFGVDLHPFTLWRMGRYAALRNLKYLFYPFLLERMVARAARRMTFDLLVSQHTISAVAAGRLRTRLRVPVVMNFLDYLTGFMETWPGWAAPASLVRALMRFELSLPSRYQVDGIMTVSDTLADYFANAGFPLPRIRPIYYGYDAEAFPFSSGDEAAAGGPPVVVMHGSFDHHHLGRVALDALSHVHAAMPEAIFRFVGRETPSLRRFGELARRRAPGLKMECTGFVPYDRVAQELAGARVGLVPYEESAGTHCAFVAKLVEYLAVGVPVACTRLDNAQRYFKEEPVIRFTEFDGAAFGAAVVQWLREPRASWQAAARRAGERVRAELDWRVICGRAVDFLEATARR